MNVRQVSLPLLPSEQFLALDPRPKLKFMTVRDQVRTFRMGIPFTDSTSIECCSVSGSVCFSNFGPSNPDPVNALMSLPNEKKAEGSESFDGH